MTALLRPFTGFVPASEQASRIVGPASSMLSREQKMASRTDELSFRNSVGRGARAPHAAAMAWLQNCLSLDALRPVDSVVVVHRLKRGDFAAKGLLADVALGAYDRDNVRRHEATIDKTRHKMVEYMQSTRLLGNPVALAHRDDAELAHLLDRHSQGTSDVAFETIDGTEHHLWIVGGDDAQTLCDAFDDVLYITDGHHRLAAASWLAADEGRPNPHLPAALFAESELQLGAFARAIDDDDLVPADIITSLDARFELEEAAQLIPRPEAPHQMGVRIGRRSFLLTVPASEIPADTYASLDVNLLQDLVLEPLFGITNPRTDARLRFIADTPVAEHDVDGCAAWFLPFPASVRDVMTVADSGNTMPPKSTYFMPKVPSGLIIRPVGDKPI